MAGEWPLVGREGELSWLTGMIRSAGRRGAVLAGSAGVGKSRLAAECLAETERAGQPTARATATRSAAHLPFGALAALLPPIEDMAVATPQHQAAFLRRCCSALAERGAGQRLVLLVDDAHLLDDASATLTHQLAETGSAFVLATLRTGEVAPDAVAALWKDGLVERLDLGGLPADAIEELLGAALGGPIDRATVARLAARCQGNVLFLRELVLGAVASGALARDGEMWRLVGALTLSERLVELVEARLGKIGEEERALLELVAVGEPLGTAEVAALADPVRAEALERQSLLKSRVDGRRLKVGLAHPLYGEVLRPRIPALRLRAMNRALADAVEAMGARRREDVLRVGTWRLDGGGTVDPTLMLVGARQAHAHNDLALAERLAKAARLEGGGFEAGLLVGLLMFRTGRTDEAETYLASLNREVTDDAQRTALAITRVASLVAAGRVGDAIRAAEEAEEAIPDLGLRAQVAAWRTFVLLISGHVAKARDLAESLLDRATGPGLVIVCVVAAFTLGRSGRLADVLSATDRGLATHSSLGDSSPFWFGPGVHWCFRCEALSFAGRFREAEALARLQYDQAIAEGSHDGQTWAGWALSRALLGQGRIRSAARWARLAAALFREEQAVINVAYNLMTLARALALAGRTEDAEKTIVECDDLCLVEMDEYIADALPARAWTQVSGGNLPGAADLLRHAARVAERQGSFALESAALHDLARLGHAAEAAPRLGELATMIEGELIQARVAHATALARGDAPALQAASEAFEAMGADLLAAEAASDAAVTWRRSRDPRRAAAAQRRAAILAARCEGATTPALQAAQSRALLTKAEREVVLLAAAGHANKAIAESLFLSRKTVENYLHRAYEKLGVSSRAELPAALET